LFCKYQSENEAFPNVLRDKYRTFSGQNTPDAKNEMNKEAMVDF